ncbi:3-keto-disaccharide hydrolase [Algoriphagus namhaensis]
MFQKSRVSAIYVRHWFTPLVLLLSLGFISCESKKGPLAGDFEGWEIYGGAAWSFEGEELVGVVSDSVGFVMSEMPYSDFRLEVEFKPDSSINSGIYLRCQNKEISFTDCYEFNIWDLHPNQDFRTGSVVNIAPPLQYVETIDQWNTYEIELSGTALKAWVKGVQTVDLQDLTLEQGFIALQAMGTGEIRFRNLNITPTTRK